MDQLLCPKCGSLPARSDVKEVGEGYVAETTCSGCGYTWSGEVDPMQLLEELSKHQVTSPLSRMKGPETIEDDG